MKNIGVRRVELNRYNNEVRRALDTTVSLYRLACKEILLTVEECWDDIVNAGSYQDKLTFVESLIHKTRHNPNPKYPLFDVRFYKFPSYYRRSAIHFVLGAYSSYMSNLAKYNKCRYEAISNGKKFTDKKPHLESMNSFPVLYKQGSFEPLENGKFKIKVYIRNTWDWIAMSMPNRDKNDLDEYSSKGNALSPTLVFAYGKYNLDFPIEYKYELKELQDVKSQRILAVDMGINCDAVCSVMCGDGTIESRHFINLGSEKDCLDRLINRTRKLHRMSGKEQSLSHIWTKISGVKQNHARQLASRISKLAVSENVDVVVFEKLGNMEPKGDKKERIHHWCKIVMQDIACGLLHRNGIRYAFVNPAKTSQLAFDGSGEVKRHKNNFSVCTFKTGKEYNCDLNASYNIGARYYIKQYLESFDENQKLQLQAKVPDVVKRTNCTLATYRSLLEAASQITTA